jgi:hypothetical protein
MNELEIVESVADYATALKALGAAGLERPFWFRGHRNSAYRLSPSALRVNSFRTNSKHHAQTVHAGRSEFPIGRTNQQMGVAVPSSTSWCANPTAGLERECARRSLLRL